MLAERFLSPVFDQIANAAVASPHGICTDLAQLETAAADKEKPQMMPDSQLQAGSTGDRTYASKTGEITKPSSLILNEWISSPSILAWAAVQPPLATEDLRPYLFVTKDRKDYFGPASVLGHLAAITERLFGPKIVVQALESDLTQIAAPEAAQVFKMVRSRIIGSDSFDTEPPGIAGLEVLVKAQPALQTNFMNFLESLPPEHLGPWAVAGWASAIKDSELQTRFDRLLQNWTAETVNPFLKGAAQAALQTRKSGQ